MKEDINSIYSIYFQDIYRFLLSLCQNHHTSEDLVQETFVRAHLYLESYKGENVKSWLFTIAHRVFIDYYRKYKKVLVKEEDFFSSLIDEKAGTELAIMEQELIREILNLLKDLPEKHKMAVLLHDFHHFSHQEASGIMHVKQPHFKVLLFRGRQAIRSRRDKENDR